MSPVAARSLFLAIERRITRAALVLGCLALILAFLAGAWQVLARFVLFQPASWSEPFIQISLIWMTYFALAAAMRSGSLISVDLMMRMARGRAAVLLRLFGGLAVLALLLVLLWFGAVLVWRVRFQTIAGLNMSASWAYLSLPVGAFLAILGLLAHLLDPPAETPAPAAD